MSQPYSSGFIVVPNDDLGMSGVIISSTSGSIAALTGDLGRGETGSQLLNGTFAMLHNSGTDVSIRIFDTSFAALFTTHLYTNSNASFLDVPLASDTTSTFYMMEYPGSGGSTPVVVFSCSSLGVAGTSWTLDVNRDPGGVCMGVSTDNTVLYYGNCGSSGGGNQGRKIKRWDLINNLPLGDFITPEATAIWSEELIVIPGTNSLIVVCQPDQAVQNFELRRYSTVDASLISTIHLPFDSASDSGIHISLDLDGPTQAFWTRTFENSASGMSNFRQYVIPSTTPVTNLEVPTDSGDPTKVPLSCPFFAWSDNLTPPVPPEPTFVGTAERRELVRVRQVGLPALPGNVTQFIGRAEVQMQPGLGVPDDPTQAPTVQMEWSGDNAVTFNTAQPLSLGRTGAYYTRAYKHVVGSLRQPAVKLICSDDVTFVPTDLFVTREEGTG